MSVLVSMMLVCLLQLWLDLGPHNVNLVVAYLLRQMTH